MDYLDIAHEVVKELNLDSNVLAVLLYGSVARGTTNQDSDIDLLVLTKSYQLEKRQESRRGVIIEFLNIHEDFLSDFIEREEVPVLNALSEGKLLLDRESKMKYYISLCKEKLEKGPKHNKLDTEEHQIYIRSKLTEMYRDLTGIDMIVFNYMTSEMVRIIVPILYHQNRKWLRSDRGSITVSKGV